MIYCSNCGKTIPIESKFCTFCGAAVPTLDTGKNLNIRKTQAYPFSNRPLDFIRSPGFWGSLLVLIGFFLPWIQDINKASGLNIITEYTMGKLVLLIFPLCALFILIDNLSGFLPSGASIFFKILPFVLLVVLTALLIMGSKQKGASVLGVNISDMQSAIKLIGIGLWATLIGSVLMLFHKRFKRA